MKLNWVAPIALNLVIFSLPRQAVIGLSVEEAASDQSRREALQQGGMPSQRHIQLAAKEDESINNIMTAIENDRSAKDSIAMSEAGFFTPVTLP